MDSFLVYNTDEYELSDFILKVEIINKNTEEILLDRNIIPDKLLIWKINEDYGLIDVYSKDSIIINDINVINSFIKENLNLSLDINIRFYPNRNKENEYIELHPSALNSFAIIDRNLTISHDFMVQIDIQSVIGIKYLDKYYEDIQDTYENITRQEANLTEDEEKYLKETIKEEENPDWYITNTKNKSGFLAKKIKSLQGISLSTKSKKENKPVVVNSQDETIFDPSTLKIKQGSEHPMEDLDNIIGLENVRHEIEKLKYTLEYKKERKSRGIEDTSINSLHMCFYGSPARIMTGLLYEMGYIKENKCVEINGLEFKGGYIGQTEIITKGILDTSQGGVLFVDEAYALCNGDNDSYGQEAVNTFIKEMEDNRDKLIVIFAGYEKDMEKFLNTNSGFRSRINRYFKFENYTVIELSKILINILKNKHLKITESALRKCMIIFKKAQQYHEFGNGRFVNNLLEKVEEQHMLNVMDETDENIMDTLTIEDIPDKLIQDLFNALKY